MINTEKPSSLPRGAKRVFQGKIFEVWQWEQKMFDGTTEVFEKIKRPDTVQVIPVIGDKILIQRQEQPTLNPFLSLAGGRVEKGEKPLDAAQRELKEESGYVSSNWFLWKKENPSTKIISTIYTYIAKDCHLEAEQTLDSGEKIESLLLNFDEFLALSDNDLFRNRDIITVLLKLRLSPKKKKEFYNLLFKKGTR